MSALDKIGIRVAPFSHRIVLARFGVDPNLALETKDATSEFFQAIVEYAFDGKMPALDEAAEASFGGGDEQFIMLIRRVDPAVALTQPVSNSGDRKALAPQAHMVGMIAAFEQAHPEFYWHIAKGKITAGEPLYGAIITTQLGTEIGHGESDVSADDAFRLAVEVATNRIRATLAAEVGNA